MKFYRENQSVSFIDENGNYQSLYVLKQETKGPGNEFVKILNLPGSNGREWLSLNRLKNFDITEIEVEPKRPKRIFSNSGYLTQEEKDEIELLENRIREIKENAKKRQPIKPDLNKNIDDMTTEELIEYVKQLQEYKKSIK